jgi:hypothetical protein
MKIFAAAVMENQNLDMEHPVSEKVYTTMKWYPRNGEQPVASMDIILLSHHNDQY